MMNFEVKGMISWVFYVFFIYTLRFIKKMIKLFGILDILANYICRFRGN